LGFTRNVLDDVRSQIAPDDAALKEARERRDTTRAAAEDFDGVRHSFASDSLAHGTANCPIHERDKGLDADTGVVLNRRSHPTLGPDAEDQDGPTPIVEAMRDHLRRELRLDYPQVKFRITKRAILITFHEPLPGGRTPPWTSSSGWSGPASPACGSRTPRPKPGIPRIPRSTPAY
jgi:hypothetical protein